MYFAGGILICRDKQKRIKYTVIVLAFIMVLAVLSKVPGLKQPEAVLFWLIHVILGVLKFLAVIGVAAIVLIGAISAWGEWRNSREDREGKKTNESKEDWVMRASLKIWGVEQPRGLGRRAKHAQRDYVKWHAVTMKRNKGVAALGT
jgi:hypothetical protein